MLHRSKKNILGNYDALIRISNWGFFSGGKLKVLTTDCIKRKLLAKLEGSKIDNKIIILSKQPSKEAIHYKNVIIKRCNELKIEYVDHEFVDESVEDIINYVNSFEANDGFIVLSPFGIDYSNIKAMKSSIAIKDLDSFTYQNLGLSLEGDINCLPATAKAVAMFIVDKFKDISGKSIVIANRTNIIGKPLAMYLVTRGATVTVLNSNSKNTKEIIRNSDIFISAIGKANFYDSTYFKDGMTLIDVGTSVVNGKVIGDIDYNSLEKINVEVLTNKKGIGAITTLCLLEGLI